MKARKKNERMKIGATYVTEDCIFSIDITEIDGVVFLSCHVGSGPLCLF